MAAGAGPGVSCGRHLLRLPWGTPWRLPPTRCATSTPTGTSSSTPPGCSTTRPAEYRERIWHIETDEQGEEWLHYNGTVIPGQLHGRRGNRRAERRGPRQVVPGRAPLHRGAACGLQRQGAPPGHGPRRHRPRGAVPDDAPRSAEPRATSTSPRHRRARTTTGAPTTPRRVRDGCSAPVRCRRCTSPTTSRASPPRSAASPSCPAWSRCSCGRTPSVDWRPFNDPVYDPIWQAAQDTGLPIALHPFLAPDLPGRVRRLAPRPPAQRRRQLRRQLRSEPLRPARRRERRHRRSAAADERAVHPGDRQPGRRDELHRVPDSPAACASASRSAKFIFLEANGGWIVPWLERLDHHCKKFQWEVTDLSMLPSDYMKRQCWISFDPDEAMLAHDGAVTARRRRPHHLGLRLPAPRRQVPRCHRGAHRGARRPHASSRSRRSRARAPSPSTASAEARASEPGATRRARDSRRSAAPSRSGARYRA